MNALSWELPHDLSSPTRARRIVNDTLAAWGIALNSDAAADLRLAVDEAVGNAVTHGDGPVKMTLTRTSGAVTCQVRDHGTWVPATSGGIADPEHGRGLIIIAAVAAITTLEPGEDGTVIEFRVPFPVPAVAGLAA
jgi:anti-sigma regulatory factor (Ser/Thr protein kinase)